MESGVLIKTQQLTKDFPGVRALDAVDFDLNKGEIHAILGENGAGKSTLIKILCGVYQADGGKVFVEGQQSDFHSPRQAQLKGIRVIHQELNLLPALTVKENIFLGNLPEGALPGMINWRKLTERSVQILEHFQTSINPDSKAASLSCGEAQIVEIAQALTSDVKIFILDEPTAALNDTETEALFSLLTKMAGEGIGIIYITHRINEVFEIAQRVSVLRDGRLIGTKKITETSSEELIEMMVGRTLEEMYPRTHVEIGKELLAVEDLSTDSGLQDISLDVHAGEVVGVYGLLGSGRGRLANAIFGAEPISSGEIRIAGEAVKIGSPHQAKNLGLGYVPSDRKEEALIGPLSLRKNLTIASLQRYIGNLFFINEKQEKASCQEWIQTLDIRASSQETNIESLSGGNQQKVVFSRWLDTRAKIMILNEPTRGVDVGAKVELYRIIDDLCSKGHAVLMFSSEMPELLAISDRIIVLSEGRVTGEFSVEQATQEKLMTSAIATL